MAAARITKLYQQLSPRAPGPQRRHYAAAAGGGGDDAVSAAAATPAARLRVAAICSTYNPLQHADVIVTKFLKGISTDDGFRAPEVDVVSIWIDCVLEQDIGLHLAKQHNVPVFATIKQAMECGTGSLSVDAVLLVGEHGDYPHNERGRHQYPRRYFFEQITGVLAENKKSVPIFIDKHFAYSTTDALWMWERASALGIPLMAGSSIPTLWRSPSFVEHPLDVELESAISLGYGSSPKGGPEAYGFHALEALQCMVERRKGGESGVKSVQYLAGQAVWEARDAGLWSQELAEAAVAACVAGGKSTVPAGSTSLEDCEEPAVFLIEYTDGFKAATLMLDGYLNAFAYAGSVKGETAIQACECYTQESGPFAHFGYLSRNILTFFKTGECPYPVERTLLTTCIIDAAMESRYELQRSYGRDGTSGQAGLHGSGPVISMPPAIASCAYTSYTEMPARPLGPRPTGASIDPKSPDSTGLGVPDDSSSGHFFPDHWSRPHLPGIEVDESGVWSRYASVRWRPEEK